MDFPNFSLSLRLGVLIFFFRFSFDSRVSDPVASVEVGFPFVTFDFNKFFDLWFFTLSEKR
jgi:hypothetical protein